MQLTFANCPSVFDPPESGDNPHWPGHIMNKAGMDHTMIDIN